MDLITNKGQGSLSFASGSTLFIIQGTGVEYLDCGMIYIINKLEYVKQIIITSQWHIIIYTIVVPINFSST